MSKKIPVLKKGSYHSAKDGKFVSAAYAKRYPNKVEFVRNKRK